MPKRRWYCWCCFVQPARGYGGRRTSDACGPTPYGRARDDSAGHDQEEVPGRELGRRHSKVRLRPRQVILLLLVVVVVVVLCVPNRAEQRAAAMVAPPSFFGCS